MRWGPAGVGLALAGVLAACGGGTPTADPSSPTPISSIGSPTTPSAATATTSHAVATEDSVVAAVRTYTAALNVVARTGNLGPYEDVTDAKCGCRQGLQSVAEQLTTQHLHTDATLVATDVRVLSVAGGKAKVSVAFVNAPYRIFNSANDVTERAPAATNHLGLDMQIEGDKWLVYTVES